MSEDKYVVQSFVIDAELKTTVFFRKLFLFISLNHTKLLCNVLILSITEWIEYLL